MGRLEGLGSRGVLHNPASMTSTLRSPQRTLLPWCAHERFHPARASDGHRVKANLPFIL